MDNNNIYKNDMTWATPSEPEEEEITGQEQDP